MPSWLLTLKPVLPLLIMKIIL